MTVPQMPRREINELTREELIELLQDQPERGIRLTFSGKSTARAIARRVRPRVMRSVSQYSVGTPDEQALNLVIEGENLQALTTLYRYRGQVDLILTDPPYNTGKDFRYNDRWDEDPNDPELGDLVSELDGARHTKWAKFMWPRLMVMRDMLKPTGVFAMCIDHRELFRLGMMLNEIFGEENRLAIINWEKAHAPKNNTGHVSTATEYVLVYAKNLKKTNTRLLPRDNNMDSGFLNIDDDPNGSWEPKDPTAREHRANTAYAIQSPFTGNLHYPNGEYSYDGNLPEPRAHWTGFTRKELKVYLESWGCTYIEKDIGDGRGKAFILKGSTISLKNYDPSKDSVIKRAKELATKRRELGNWPQLFWRDDKARNPGAGRPRMKVYSDEIKKGKVPTTWWVDDEEERTVQLGSQSWEHEESGHSDLAKKELDAVVGKNHGFDTVKPLRLITKLIQLWCPTKGLILDPFAGSGTTGHAVLKLNAETDAARRFILIEMGRPERGDAYARGLTADRLRRVITGSWAIGKQSPVPGGFSFQSLQQKVDAKAVLSMERDEMTDTVIASHFDFTRRGGPGLTTLTHENYRYLVAKNADGEGFFLVWEGKDKVPVFDETVYDAIVDEAAKAGLKPIYHVYARFNLYQSGDVRFYQIPTRILLDFGLNEATDAFNEL